MEPVSEPVHVCEVCGQDANEHPEACYDEAHGRDVPARHWPAPCCPGCPCLSWEEAHLPDLRAITVKQPWAWAIAHGGKTVENRSKVTSYRGLLLIHAGKAWSGRGAVDERVRLAWRQKYRNPTNQHLLPVGMVVAVAQLADSHPDAGCCRPWGESSYTEAGGRKRTTVAHLVLEDVRPLGRPTWARGALGLWRPQLMTAVEALQQVGLLPHH